MAEPSRQGGFATFTIEPLATVQGASQIKLGGLSCPKLHCKEFAEASKALRHWVVHVEPWAITAPSAQEDEAAFATAGALQDAAEHENVAGLNVPKEQLREASDAEKPGAQLGVHAPPCSTLEPSAQATAAPFVMPEGAVHRRPGQLKVGGSSAPRLQLSCEAEGT